LRPTLSKGLYVQMVGRGLRLHPDKQDCLVLDYAHCIDEHGPIDCIDGGSVKLETCQQCGDVFSRAVRKCPHCGWEIPPQRLQEQEIEEKKKKKNMHDTKVSTRNILGDEPEWVDVHGVSIHRHTKSGKPDSLRIQYRNGLSTYREWVCPEHGGSITTRANRWLQKRFASKLTVDDVMENLVAYTKRLQDVTEAIQVKQSGKYQEIINHKLRSENDLS